MELLFQNSLTFGTSPANSAACISNKQTRDLIIIITSYNLKIEVIFESSLTFDTSLANSAACIPKKKKNIKNEMSGYYYYQNQTPQTVYIQRGHEHNKGVV